MRKIHSVYTTTLGMIGICPDYKHPGNRTMVGGEVTCEKCLSILKGDSKILSVEEALEIQQKLFGNPL